MQMIKCKNCGAENELEGGSPYCYACGKVLHLTCERGHDYPATHSRCPICPTAEEQDRFRPNFQAGAGNPGPSGGKTEAWEDERALAGWLVIIRGFNDPEYTYFSIRDGENTIGNAQAGGGVAIRLNDRSVSEKHAVLWREDGKYFLSDERSSNGTRVNGRDLNSRVPVELADDDHIEVGRTLLVFKSYLNPLEMD